MTYTASVKISLSDFRRVNALLNIESLQNIPKDTARKLGVKTDAQELIFSAAFETGAGLDLYLCSGNENYYTEGLFKTPEGDLVVLQDSVDVVLSSEESFLVGSDVYTIYVQTDESPEGKYLFYLPLGDFSGDGHGRCDNFLVEAAKPVQAARDAHHRILEATGIDIAAIASDNDVIPKDIVGKLVKLGYRAKEPLYNDERGVHLMSAGLMEDLPEALADIWVFLLNKADPDLHAVLVPDEVPILLTSGKDEKGRTCRSVGYGLYMN